MIAWWAAVELSCYMWLPGTVGVICRAPNVYTFSANITSEGVDGTGLDLVQSWLPSIELNQVAVFVRRECFFFDRIDVEEVDEALLTVVPV